MRIRTAEAVLLAVQRGSLVAAAIAFISCRAPNCAKPVRPSTRLVRCTWISRSDKRREKHIDIAAWTILVAAERQPPSRLGAKPPEKTSMKTSIDSNAIDA